MPPVSKPRVIHIATALIFDEQGRILLVRKHGSNFFMQAGGKIEDGETALEAATRELNEELGITANLSREDFLGTFTAQAANEPGHQVQAEVFRLTLSGPVQAQAEIAAALWVDPTKPPHPQMAPLTRDTLLPLAHKLLLSAKTGH